MNCEILSTLYIRSNGDVPCNDDAGEKIILGKVSPRDTSWDPESSVLHNPRYSHIRESLIKGIAPWPDTCPGCAFFRPNEPLVDLLAGRRIRKLQVEPSLACNLQCPCCSNLLQIKTRPKPLRMSLDTFEAVLESLRQESFALDEIEYCGQGEPLLHPQFPEFVKLARSYFPNTFQRLITNGNFEYKRAIGEQRLEQIFVSCDGVYQSNYVQYRVRGNVELPLQFMRDVPREVDGLHQTLVWKYILFEFNDSDEEIRAAQELAQEIGVDTLLFVFTHSAYKSLRHNAENASGFPIYFPNVTTNATPIHYQDSDRANLTLCILEDVSILDGTWLNIRGWALSSQSITGVRLAVDGRVIGYARQGLPRPDVLALHRGFREANSGFAFEGSVGSRLCGNHLLEVTSLGCNGPIKTIRHTLKYP